MPIDPESGEEGRRLCYAVALPEAASIVGVTLPAASGPLTEIECDDAWSEEARPTDP